MTSPLQSSTIDSLPKQFVAAMRTLFDIMDDKRTGLVDFADIERRWQDDGSKGLPKGVIESLRKVTPANGLLTFERFCAGLKICLLRNQVDQRNNNQNHQNQNTESAQVLVNHRASDSCSNRPPSAPILDVDLKPSWANTAAIRPNNVMAQQRTLSMPQLLANERKEAPDSAPKPVPNVNKPALYGPPKPPRTALGLEPRNMDRAEIRNALQNWQLGLMLSDQENSRGLLRTGRSLGDGKDEAQANMYQKKGNVRRREPRRHTLQNGIDYNMLKRMKQIEQEKDVLVQGLGAIEKARDWYLKQIAAVQDKMKYLGRMGHVEHWTEAQQERLELQRARVFEVNRHLSALTDSWERGGLPLHMNLAVNHYPQDITTRLKQQNHLLTEEVGKKSERITILEREKASLIRELLQNRAPSARQQLQEEAVF